MIPENYIPKIAETVSYINGPEGDIPSIQIDGWRYTATEGIPVKDGMEICFHTKSLPAAGATLSAEDEGEQMTL